MRILCAYSGIEFETSHVPGFLSSREAYHPVFTLSPHKILNYSGKWAAGSLTPTDSYLLFLAGLHATELVEWRVPVLQTPRTDSIVAQNMLQLFNVLGKLDVIKNPSFATPHYVISPETKTLDNVKYWLQAWLESYKDFQEGYKSVSLNQKILRKEFALERLIKSKHKDPSSYAHILAEWACLAGDFPTFAITLPDGSTTDCATYWKSIIVQVGKRDAIWKINHDDLHELIEHCEDNLEAGTIYFHSLLTYLRNAEEEITNPFGFGRKPTKNTPFAILPDEDNSTETANLVNIALTAPTELPQPSQYPTKLEYLKAKVAFQLAQKYKNILPTTTAPTESAIPADKFDI